MTQRVWSNGASIIFAAHNVGEQGMMVPAGSLTCSLEGNQVWARNQSGDAYLSLDYTRLRDKADNGFTDAAAAKAYLDEEFDKRNAGQVALDSLGEATITFPEPFERVPYLSLTVNDPDDAVVSCTAAKVQAGGFWTGATIKAYRIVPLPEVTITNVVTMLNLFRTAQLQALEGIMVDWIAR